MIRYFSDAFIPYTFENQGNTIHRIINKFIKMVSPYLTAGYGGEGEGIRIEAKALQGRITTSTPGLAGADYASVQACWSKVK